MSLYYIVQDNTIIDGPTLLPAPLRDIPQTFENIWVVQFPEKV